MSKICKKCDVLETNDNNDYCGICANELVADLEAKLAESEEKINMLEEHKFCADNIIQAYADKCKKANQDKISLRVEQLKNSQQEKIELLEKLRKHYCHLIWDGRGADECWVIQECVDILDKQIEELKKGENNE